MPQLSSIPARRTALAFVSALAVGALMPSITSAQQPAATPPPAAAPAAAPAAVSASPSVAPNGRVFEMRTYYCHPGRLEALNKRFRDHTNRLFVKHGMTIVGFWTPTNKPNALIYILAYKDRAARDASWKAFQSDPEWVKVRTEMNVGVDVEAIFMSSTDYGPMK